MTLKQELENKKSESKKSTKVESNHISKKQNNLPYHSILVDQEIKSDLIKIMPKITTLPIIPISNFLNNNQQIDYFCRIINESNRFNKRPLLISKHQKNIVCCHNLKIDTCFINTGFNDMIDYKSTYEVTSID